MLSSNFGRKAMPNLDSILRSRDIILLTKVHIVKAVFFPVVMYRYGSWTINNTGELMPFTCKYLESPLDCKEIKTVNPKGDQS